MYKHMGKVVIKILQGSAVTQTALGGLTTPCPRKKQATLIFDITSPSVEIFFTIFEAPSSGLIAG